MGADARKDTRCGGSPGVPEPEASQPRKRSFRWLERFCVGVWGQGQPNHSASKVGFFTWCYGPSCVPPHILPSSVTAFGPRALKEGLRVDAGTKVGP